MLTQPLDATSHKDCAIAIHGLSAKCPLQRYDVGAIDAEMGVIYSTAVIASLEKARQSMCF